MFDRMTVTRPFESPAMAHARPYAWQLVTPVAAAVSLVVALVLFNVSWSILILIAFVPVFEILALPATVVRRRQTATFLLIVAAATLGHWSAALAVGLAGMAIEQWTSTGTNLHSSLIRPLILAGLIGTGAMIQSLSWVALPAMVLWVFALGIWLVDRQRHARSVSHVPALIALAWLALLLSMPAWLSLVPATAGSFLNHVVAGLAFAVGFMTVDSLFASTLGLRRDGVAGIQFWRSELIPTFARYNAMAATGALLGALLLIQGTTGLVIAISGLAALLVGMLVIFDRERAHHRLVATVCALSSALDARDPYTRGHSDRVAAYAVGIAKHLGWNTRRLNELELAAHLHDVGKIGVPDAILLKPGLLTPDEYAVIQGHVEQSAAIVRNVPDLRQVAEHIWQHHERLDGSGYPHGLTGAEITPAARILGIADSFDAMTSDRSYRAAMPVERAIHLIGEERATKYDPQIVDALNHLVLNEEIEGVLVYTYCLSH
jgi:hypothetical protein